MRCLLFASDLPRYFWSLAETTAAYLHNSIPNRNTQGKTPQELLLKEKTFVKHLRIFGSWVFVHIPHELRKKLDHCAIKCCLVRYLARSNAGGSGIRWRRTLSSQRMRSGSMRVMRLCAVREPSQYLTRRQTSTNCWTLWRWRGFLIWLRSWRQWSWIIRGSLRVCDVKMRRLRISGC